MLPVCIGVTWGGRVREADAPLLIFILFFMAADLKRGK
jgi:hypothetical protein